MAKKREGKEVRLAYDGPKIEHDQLIGKIDRWNGEDRARASGAAETRSDIGLFTETTGINPKALSMLRTIKKVAARDGGQAKAMDIIASLKKGLPMIEADIAGQSPQLPLEDEHEQGEEPEEGSNAHTSHDDDFDAELEKGAAA